MGSRHMVRAEGSQGKFLDLVIVFQNASGQIFVSDYGNDRLVQMDDLEGEGWTTCKPKATVMGQLKEPHKTVAAANVGHNKESNEQIIGLMISRVVDGLPTDPKERRLEN